MGLVIITVTILLTSWLQLTRDPGQKERQMEYLLYWLFFELIGCSIARFVIPALSFGQAYVHPLNAPSEGFNWLGYRRDRDGRIVVARDVAGFIGFIIMMVAFLTIVLRTHPF